jgi:flagellar hook-associated protein 1 FlgK
MQAQQLALETSAHNIANSETEGFSRQRALMAATPALPYPSMNSSAMVGQVGTGVEVANVERLRDQYLDVQLRKESATLGEWSIKQDALEQVEVIFQEPTETGLNNLLTQFWDSWQELSKQPESTSSAVRTTVIETAASLADALRHTVAQLDSLSEDMDSIIDIKVMDINSIANQVTALNEQIKVIKTAGLEANDLLDKRDVLLDELASMIDIRTVDNGDGTIDVNLYNSTSGNYDNPLVDGLAANSVTVDSVHDAATSGELKGLFEVRDELLVEYNEDLDVFAQAMIDGVNSLHAQGYDLNGEHGLPFFVGTGAADIDINPEIEGDILKLAASSTLEGIPGDGSNALAISNLRNTANATLGSGFNDYYRNIISRLGVETNEASRMCENQQALFGQLEQRKQSISGVSIDEEMAHMVEFQHAYEAAARFLTTMDGLLDTLINRTAV